ncbi:MAG: ABC transporter permease, partial [Anaerolineae bacterium]
MIPILWRASVRDLTRHRWQTALSILGIALGVAMVVAVDIANESARRAFELSVERVAGRATHQIESATGHLTDSQYADLAPDLAAFDASPVIEATVRIGSSTFTLLGLDPLAMARLNPIGAGTTALSLGALMAEPGALLLGRRDAEHVGAQLGDALRLTADGSQRPAHLAGIIADRGEGPVAEMAGLALADIATAQELTGRVGRI